MHLAAAVYLSYGWSLFPVTPGRKAPPLLKWEEYQSRHPTYDELVDWWSRWPQANIGIVTGTISNLSVIDVDASAGGLDSLKSAGVSLPKSRLHKTPRGYHLLYQHQGSLHTGAGFLQGIDVRSNGGYIVAPPSRSEYGLYSILRDGQPLALLDVPLFLRSRARKEEHKTTPHDPSWVAEAMRGVPEEQRNDTATRLVGYYHAKNLPRSVISEIMRVYARACRPPMDEYELEQTIDSVLRYPGGTSQKAWSGW